MGFGAADACDCKHIVICTLVVYKVSALQPEHVLGYGVFCEAKTAVPRFWCVQRLWRKQATRKGDQRLLGIKSVLVAQCEFLGGP